MRLAAAEQSSIQAAVRAGFISTQAAAKLLDNAGERGFKVGDPTPKSPESEEST